MIVVALKGGLGNQLFQYAAGRAFALRLGRPLRLDLSELERRRWSKDHTPRAFELAPYDIRAELVHRDATRLRRAASSVLPAALLDRATGTVTLGERDLPRPAPHRARARVLRLEGYFQSERFFANAEGEIRRDLRPRNDLRPAHAALLERIRAGTSASLHLRRGDYLTNPAASAHHGVLPLDYYRAALAELRRRVGSPSLFVFSDEPGWAREHLDLPEPFEVVGGEPGRASLAPFEDLWLMSQCQHHVIANSSFSWWGAWLGTCREKVVIAPARWFADEATNAARGADVVPGRWLRV